MNLHIDIGGTYIRYQLDSLEVERVQSDDPIAVVDGLIAKYPMVEKIFISFAGQVSGGIIFSAPNIDIKDLDIKARFAPKEVYIDNDLNCAVLAQSRYFDEPDIVALYIGTGMGSGIVSGGHLIRGVNNLAGEVGHIAFKQAPFFCGCSKDNCIELFSSGSGIDKWAAHYQKEFKQLQDLPEELYGDFLEGMMRAASTLITLFNPKILVLGGGVIENNPFLIDYIKENISRYAFHPAIEGLQIVASKIPNAPLEGCRLLEEA